MAILNYTTKIAPEQSVGQITSLLVRKGARAITSEFGDAGDLTAVTFVMAVGGMPVRYQLPANVAGVAAVLKKDNPWKSARQGSFAEWERKHLERASWVAWRILKDWVEAQVAMIESGQVEAAQIFLPYAQGEDGRTMYELFVDSNQKRLSAGASDA